MTSLVMRETNDDRLPYELCVIEGGEVVAVYPMTDRAMTDHYMNLSPYVRSSWQRLRQHIQIGDKA